jgi:hypothetical protein
VRRAERERIVEIGRLHGQIDTLTELNSAIKASDARAVSDMTYTLSHLFTP